MSKGFEALPSTWSTYCAAAEAHGQKADRATWRLVGPVHIAETREQARANVRYGFQAWLDYFTRVGTLPLGVYGDGNIDVEIDALLNAGVAVIGTPDDLLAQISRLEQKSGGFGCFLSMSHNWADFVETKRSYELIARHVMPRLRHQLAPREQANRWAKQQHGELSERRRVAAAREQAKL
jgi:limonene 1,2-monooxygenase